jgi:hypothetical protein
MADQLAVHVGAAPWAPWPGIETAKVYQKYNGVPYFGTLSLHGSRYLFVRRYAGEDRLSLWMYIQLTDVDAGMIESALGSSPDLLKAVDQLEARGNPVYAAVDEDRTVLACIAYSSGELHEGVNRLFEAGMLPVGLNLQAEQAELLSAISAE